jgi:plastocyanin
MMMQRMNGFLRFFLTAVFFLFCSVTSVFSATVDVMIVYDSTAKAWVDSNAGMTMTTFAEDAVARMNQAAVNSGVNITFRMVHAEQVSYTYSGDLGTDLTRLQAGTGNLSVVSGLRDTYGADIVTMLVDTGSEFGTVGIGYQLATASGQSDLAFSVCAIQSVNNSHTLTHEVGHNFGCGHSKDQVDSPGPGLYSYSAGWYFTGTNAVAYNTIMAYNDMNGDGIADHVEAPLFSTPLLPYQGTVAGDAANGDNAQTIRNTMDVVAAYRPTAIDDTPTQFTFIDQTGVALNTVITSNTITVSGINSPAAISITGGTYSINNSGSYTSADGTVNNGDTVTVQLTSSGNYSTTTNATLTIGGVSDTFSLTTLAGPDTTPNTFTFTSRAGVALSTVITSNTITVSGIDTPTTISIAGGTYSINSGSYTSASGTVNNGDTVTLQLTSAANYSTTTYATLTIGGVLGIFRVKTMADPNAPPAPTPTPTPTPDTTPDQFTFTDQTNVTLSTVITSNTITVSGITSATPISITGGTYSINSGAYKSTSGTVNNGYTVTIHLTSSGNYSTTTNATLTIGGISDTFSVTTQSAPPDMIPDQFTFTDQTDAALSTVITSNTITVSGITSTTPISITGGTYSINGESYTSADGTVNPGDTVTVQQTSSESHSTTTNATLTIGGISDTFSVTTISSSSGGGGAAAGGGGGGGCFIATAAFGSPMAGQVEILRQFRDRYLLTNAPGQKFVAWYYRNGPAAADYIKDKPLAKAAVRVALYPLIGFSLLLINGMLPYLLLAITGFIIFFRFRTKKLSAM